jgi:CheY-like chemotaxis protein
MSEPEAEKPQGGEAPKNDAAAPAEAPKAEAAPAEAPKAEAAPAEALKESAPEAKEHKEKHEHEGHKKKKEAHAEAPAPAAAPAPAPAAAPVAAASAKTKGKLLLVAWPGSAAAAWADGLGQAGYDVYHEGGQRLAAFQWASEHQPVAAVIDLSTQLEDGQRLATTLRITGATAAIPVVFCHAGGQSQHPTSLEAVLSRLSKL